MAVFVSNKIRARRTFRTSDGELHYVPPLARRIRCEDINEGDIIERDVELLIEPERVSDPREEGE